MRQRRLALMVGIISWVVSLFFSPVMSGFAAESVSLGLLQYVEHESLNAVREGFMDQLREAGYEEGQNLTLHELNAAADNANLQSMSERLTAQSDYLLAIGTPAAQSLASVTEDLPIYFSAVSDPLAAGLVQDLDQPDGNVTGTLDAAPLAQQVQVLEVLVPEAKTVGILYNSGETNSVSEVALVEELLDEKGLQVEKYSVTSTNDIHQVMTPMVQEVDVIFLVTDNTIANAMTLVGDIAKEADLAVIGGSKDMVEKNGLATYGLDYYELGKQTARMFVRHLEEGEEVGHQGVERAEHLELILNEEVAQVLGLDLDQVQWPSFD